MALPQIQTLLDKAFGNTLIPGLPVARSVEQRSSTRTYDTATGLAARAETVHQREAVVMTYSAKEIAESGGLIQTDDRLLLLRHMPFLPVPNIDDRILFDSQSYVIVAIEQQTVGATPLLHRCQCRRGD